MIIFLSPRRVSPFLAWGDFHARSTIPEEKWGTTLSLALRMSRPLFVGSYLQVTWWALGR